MTEKQTEHNMLMKFIEDDCFVNTQETIEYPPVALSFKEKLVSFIFNDFIYKHISCLKISTTNA